MSRRSRNKAGGSWGGHGRRVEDEGWLEKTERIREDKRRLEEIGN